MKTRVLRFLLLLAGSWLVMTFSHEAGHLIGGWCCGGHLAAADLIPWRLPYSIFDPDPRPLVTLWCGPLLGALVPLGLASLIRREWLWFIAHFCVLANGVYLATAWWSGDSLLDTAKLLEHGASRGSIVIYCLLTIGYGYSGFRQSCIRALSPAPPAPEREPEA